MRPFRPAVSRTVLLASVSVLLLALPGCQYRSPKDTYYLIATNQKVAYWKAAQDGFNAAAAQYRVTARIAGPDGYDPQAEANALSEAIAARPAGILISAGAAPALQSGIANAISAGVPIITVDSDAPQSQRLYFIGTNNLQAGRTGGQRLVDRLHGKGNVVFFSIPGQPNIEDRLKGYMEQINEHPGIKVLDVVGTAGDSGSAFDHAQQYAAQTGEKKIDAFVCLESESGKAVAEVLKRNNLTDRVLIAMDVDPDTLTLIKSGVIDSTVSQRPYTMGYVGLKMLDEAHHAHKGAFRADYSVDFLSPYPTFIDTGSSLITKDNVSLYEHPVDEASQEQ